MTGRTSRSRASVALAGSTESKLRGRRKLSHSDLDPQGLLTPEVMQEFLKAGMCPYCERGPFKVVAIHTNSAHGMDRRELKDAAGVTYEFTTASPELSRRLAKLNKRRDMAEMRAARKGGPRKLSPAAKELNQKKLEAVREEGRIVAAVHARAARQARILGAESRIREGVAAGRLLVDIAEDLGISPKTLGEYVRELGITDGRSLPGTRRLKSEAMTRKRKAVAQD